jgi:hypothetical protein
MQSPPIAQALPGWLLAVQHPAAACLTAPSNPGMLCPAGDILTLLESEREARRLR